MPDYPVVTSPPWHFRLAKWLIRHKLRGGYQLIELAERQHWLDLDCRYRLSDKVTVEVPLYRRVNQLALADALAYERGLVDTLVGSLARFATPPVWIDCGADIGLLTALVAARHPELHSVIALEPNPVAFTYLARNLARLPCPAQALCKAAADFAGRGTLAHAPHDPSDHARFLQPAATGELEVVRIDDLGIPAGLPIGLKIDVEGGELAVLQGSVRTLTQAAGWVISVEAHRDVCKRTGRDPRDCLRFLKDLGAQEFCVAEAPGLVLDPTRDYFSQVNECITNVVCVRLPA